MFCYKCGTQMRDDALFCPKCGRSQEPLAPEEPQENKPSAESAPAKTQSVTSSVQKDTYAKYESAPAAVAEPVAVAVPEAPAPADSAPRVRAAVAGVIRSPLFLIATIAFTLIQLLGLFDRFYDRGIITALDFVFNIWNSIQGFLPFDFYLSKYYFYPPSWGSLGWFSYCLTLLFGLLTVAGLWLTYATAGQQGQKLRTGGLTLLKISALANLVLNVLRCMLPCFPFLRNITAFSLLGFLGFGVIMFILFIFLVIEIIFTIKICTSLSAVKRSIVTGIADHRASVLVAIICLFKLGWNILSSFTCAIYVFVNGFLFEYLTELSAKTYLIDLLYLIAFVLFGMVVFLYRKKLSQLKNAPAEEAEENN